MENTCTYRNCNNPLEGRIDKKFCCTSCRKMEQTYIKRKKKFIEDAIKRNEILVSNIKLVKTIEKEEYK